MSRTNRISVVHRDRAGAVPFQFRDRSRAVLTESVDHRPDCDAVAHYVMEENLAPTSMAGVVKKANAE